MNRPAPHWVRDGLGLGRFLAEGIGSVRSAVSYRAGGWWFLPDWLPNRLEHDIGPFRMRDRSFAEAERAARTHSK